MLDVVTRSVITLAQESLNLRIKKGVKDLRRKVSQEVHLKQADDLDTDLAKALEKFFQAQIKSVSKRLKEVGTKSTASEKIAGQIYDETEWYEELIDITLPIFIQHMGKAAQAQLKLIGIKDFYNEDKAQRNPNKLRPFQWLQGTVDADLDALTFMTSQGSYSMTNTKRWPEWMKSQIQVQLQEVYKQPFWKKINETTKGDIDKFLDKGLAEGWTLDEMSSKIRSKLKGDKDYAQVRANAIAQTESNNALNGARKFALEQIQQQVGPDVNLRPSWLSALLNTTRDTHAILDGVPASKTGQWRLGGIWIPWPGHWKLPVHERANCYCTFHTEFDVDDAEARQLIDDYNDRARELRNQRSVFGVKRRDQVLVGPRSTLNYHTLRERIRSGKAKCAKCGSKSKLRVHHIDGNGKNDSRKNLKILCDTCHRAMPDGPHAQSGKSVKDRQPTGSGGCGTGAGGFKPGNTCARGGRGKGGLTPVKRDSKGKLVMSDGSAVPSHIPKRIPPAWADVQINTNPEASLLVKGRDAKGRVQSIYSASHTMKQSQVKFAKINELRGQSDKIGKQIKKDIKSSDVATRESAKVMSLIQNTGLRPGSTTNTKAEKQAYGATTLEGRHVTISGNNVTLKFTGKKGVDLEIPIRDKQLATMLKEHKKRAGDNGKLFDTNSQKLRDYARTLGGGGFKPKDFRTAKGTSVAVDLIKKLPKPNTNKEYKARVKEVAEKVSAQLGNTPSVALTSYIDPTVFSVWKRD